MPLPVETNETDLTELTRLKQSAERTDFHHLSPEEALEYLAARRGGLTGPDAADRLQTFGANRVPTQARTGLLVVFMRQFLSPLIYVLLAAAALSLLLEHYRDFAFIFGVLVINALVGAGQEWRAEKSAAALQNLIQRTAAALRDGTRQDIDAEELVPGDILLLEPGMGVAADLRLLETRDLRLDESLITGESIPVNKHSEALPPQTLAISARSNMAFAGTLVLSGRGLALVTRTGKETEVGRIAQVLKKAGAEPPLVARLKKFARALAALIVALVVLLSIGLIVQGAPFADVLLLSMAIAVATIPEGLPVAITVALTVASNRLSRRNVIVRQLAAVEGLGACTVIASDKTGTLTINRLTIQRLVLPSGRIWRVSGEGLEPTGEFRSPEGQIPTDEDHAEIENFAIAGALANEARLSHEEAEPRAIGDTVDIAFLVLARKLNLTRPAVLETRPMVHAVPYESERRYAASVHEHGEEHVAYLKGAPEVILPRCRNIDEAKACQQVEELAREGYRVLAVAAGAVDLAELKEGVNNGFEALELLGFAAIIDPVRPEVPEAIRRCREAGVRVCMITGDHPETAFAIARDLDITQDRASIVTGDKLAQLDPEARTALIAKARVFARVEPLQKTLIVENLQKAGHFVAVTGDGVNDAPALQSADIGVAMGQNGTDVARAAADLIVTDDNFASIVNGIEEGRAAYANIRKVIWLLLSTGVAEIILIALSFVTGLPMPLTAIQLLWLNLVTQGLQDVAMAFEGVGHGIMKRRPRPPHEGVLDRPMITQCLVGGLHMGSLAFVVYWMLLSSGNYTQAAISNLLLLLMVLFENVQVFNCRSEYRSVFYIPLARNPFLLVTVIGAQTLHIAAMHIPGLNAVLGAAPVSWREWLAMLALALTLILSGELLKILRRLVPRQSGPVQDDHPGSIISDIR
ncbi:MAG: HAD family hydrolase [Alphaproteobacteria bacterium]|nr:MAG: HAD family hydrolase [Alphaproteobacteria bacterium]